MTTARSDFLKALTAEADLVRQFVELLQREKAALTEGKTDALPAIAGEKENLAASLNELSRQRGAHLTTLGFSADRQGMEAWAAKHPEQKDAIAAWDRTLSKASEAKELNRVNGQLIQLRMQYNSQALEILRRNESALDLYGPDGRSTEQGNRQINDAV